MERPPQGSTQWKNPIVSPYYVHYATIRTERLHSKPLTTFSFFLLFSSFPSTAPRSFSSLGLHLKQKQTSWLSTCNCNCNCNCNHHPMEVSREENLQSDKPIQSKTRNYNWTSSLRLNFSFRIDFHILTLEVDEGLSTLAHCRHYHMEVSPKLKVQPDTKKFNSRQNPQLEFLISDWDYCLRLSFIW